MLRFAVEGLGVTQPSQIRYIHYFHKILNNRKIFPTVQLLEHVKLFGVPSFNNKNSCIPYIEIYFMKNLEKVSRFQ